MDWKEEVNKKLDEAIEILTEKKDEWMNHIVNISFENALKELSDKIKEGEMCIYTYWKPERWSSMYEEDLSKLPKKIIKEIEDLLTQKIEEYLNENHYVWVRDGFRYWIDIKDTMNWEICRKKLGDETMKEIIIQVGDFIHKHLDTVVNEVSNLWIYELKENNWAEINVYYIIKSAPPTLLDKFYKVPIKEGKWKHEYKCGYEGVIDEICRIIYPKIIELASEKVEKYLNDNNYIWIKSDDTYTIIGHK